MVKKIIAVATAILMLCCMVPLAAFADDVLDTCPKCGERKYETWQDFSTSVPDLGFPISIKRRHCTSCQYTYYDWNCMGYTGYKEFDSGSGNLIADYLKEWKDKTFGKNATAKKYETGGGSAGTGGVGRRPSGYENDNGTPSISKAGLQAISLKPVFRYRMRSGYPLVESGEFSGLTFDGKKDATSSYSVQVSANRLDVKNTSDNSIYMGRFYVSYEYTFPDYGTVYFDTDDITWKVYGAAQITDGEVSDVKSWGNSFVYVDSTDKTYGYRSVEPNSYKFWKAFTVWDSSNWMLSAGRTGRAVFSDAIIYFKAAESPIINKTNITINNNTWNGNIYQDNSTNLTYIYPQYTTINENNETVTNISNNPIIYNNETKEYYTYDSVTNNYYYITYVTETPTPTPTDKPGGSISTPETGKPGGDTGGTSSILDVLVKIRDNMIQGFADIKATLVQGWADLSANFTLAIENLNLNITNIFNKKFPDKSTPDPALPAPVEPSTGDKWSDDIVSGTSISGTVNAKAGDYVLATVSARSALTIPDSMTYLYKGNVFASNDVNQSMSFAYQKIAEDGTYTYTFKQATAGRMYLSLIVLSDIDGLSYSGKYHIEVKSKTPVSVPEKSDGDMLVWGCSSTAWLTSDTSNSKSWITNPDDLTYIGGASNSGQSRQANFIDLGTGAVSRTFFPYENSGDNLFFVVDAVEIIPKTITPSPSPSPSPTPDHGTDPTPAPTDKPSGGNTNNFWNFVFPGGNDDGTENGHKGILWALISLLIAVVTFVLGLGSAYSYVFPFLPAGLVTTIHICVLVLLLFAIIKFVRSFL